MEITTDNSNERYIEFLEKEKKSLIKTLKRVQTQLVVAQQLEREKLI